MHNIIQEAALEIVREESIDKLGKQSGRLDPDDIYYILKNNKGSAAIRSLAIDVSTIKELQLNPKVFAKMNKLRYLDIYSKGYSYNFLRSRGDLYLPQGLQSLPNELRYLRWARFPLESLPCTFSGEKLVVLDLQYSRVKQLWREDHKEASKSTEASYIVDNSKCKWLCIIGECNFPFNICSNVKGKQDKGCILELPETRSTFSQGNRHVRVSGKQCSRMVGI
ncbi:hypothetical protein TSUD_358010 [Trifolium subterraneum]|uniref:Uncharacterized protein n=1 Tax=Trifolium subterraneum TaxID=3900 RepID=A0A2Z6NQA5_TRISU|nr:hypothetical protein TSUD_358010 [Trifolium subterraneum]